MKNKFNFLYYFLILSFFVSLGMFFKDLFYFILSYYTFENSINYINIVFYGAILYKIDLLISIICAGFLLIEKYLKFRKLKGGIENGL